MLKEQAATPLLVREIAPWSESSTGADSFENGHCS